MRPIAWLPERGTPMPFTPKPPADAASPVRVGGRGLSLRYPDTDPADEASASRRLLVLLGLFLALYCVNLLLPRDLWVQDEARYGEVVREMMQSGHWLVLHLNGYPYPDKPVLYFWVVAAVGTVIGGGALAFQLVSVLSAFAAAGAVYLLGSRLGSARFAFRATAAFLAISLTLIAGQIARMDMMLTATVAFALHAFVRRFQGGGPGSLAAFWAFALLGVAVKGPIALLFTVLPALVTAAWTEGRPGLRRLRPLLGLAALAAMVAAWALPVWALGHGDYLVEIWSRQLVGRAVNAWTHKQPFYFYLLWAPVLFMPWTPVLADGLYRLCRSPALRRRAAGETLMISFLVFPLAAISLISGKLFIYLAPLAPVAAIVAAWQLERMSDLERVPAWIRWTPAVFLVLFGTLLAVLVVHYAWPQGGVAVAAGAGIALLGAAALFVMPARPGSWFAGWLWHSVLFSWLFLGLGAWGLNPIFSPRALGDALGDALAQATGSGAAVGVVDTTRGILGYYAGSTLTELTAGEAAEWRRAHPDGALVVKDKDMDKVFPGGAPPGCRVDRVFRLDFTDFRLIAGCSTGSATGE